MSCDKDMYYDSGTRSCAYCSQLCDLVDIQGTREECEKHCPGFLERIVTPQPLKEASTYSSYQDSFSQQPAFIAFTALLCVGLLFMACYIVYSNKKSLIKRLKKQECCSDGMSQQPHVQECGISQSTAQPQDGLLANQGYPDLPNNVSMSCSLGREETQSKY